MFALTKIPYRSIYIHAALQNLIETVCSPLSESLCMGLMFSERLGETSFPGGRNPEMEADGGLKDALIGGLKLGLFIVVVPICFVALSFNSFKTAMRVGEGFDLDTVTAWLEMDGVDSFPAAFSSEFADSLPFQRERFKDVCYQSCRKNAALQYNFSPRD